jgi:hypothetical protein
MRALKVDGNLTCDKNHYPGALGRNAAGVLVCNVRDRARDASQRQKL